MPVMTAQALASEIGSDPAGLGYAARVAAGDDAGLASLLNAASGPGAASIAVPSVSKALFLTAIRPAMLALPGKDAAMQAKWDRIILAIQSVESVTIDATTQYLLGQAVDDGVLTQPQADAVWHRAGSRAEVLWGAGVVVEVSDVSFALRGAR